MGGQIEIASLTKSFRGTPAVADLGFAVKRGEIFGLVGPDGAGKTTIMRRLAGVMPPDGGRILIDGIDVIADPERAKQHLSYMPQRFGLYEDLTVDENIRFYSDRFEVPRKVSDARRYEQLTYLDVLANDLGVMDAAAISLARENALPIVVFNIHAAGAFAAVVRGEGRFTRIIEQQ